MTSFQVDTFVATYSVATISDSSETGQTQLQEHQLLAAPISGRAHRRPQVRISTRWLTSLFLILASSFPLALFCEASPSLSASPSSVAFGWVFVGSPTTKAVTLTSNGSSAITVSAATVTGNEFTVSGATFPVTLNPGQSLTLRVAFNPTTSGAAAGQLTVNSNSSTVPRMLIGLSGTGSPVVSALTCAASSMTGAGTDSCTVTLNAAAGAGGRNVVLESNNRAVGVPASIMVPANSVSAGFTATVSAVATRQSVTLTAVAGGISKSFALQLNPSETASACNITGTGTILADGSLGGSPLLGDVYQIQGTITANYIDDDEVSNSTFVATAPDGTHTVTSGLFLLNAHADGLNTYAARVAAGYESNGVWAPGTWTWQMNLQDRAGNTCTASGTYNVSATFDNAKGFLRQYKNTPNFVTDGDNQAFWPTGMGWYFPYWNGSAEEYNVAEVPASAVVNVNGTNVSLVSGTPFSVQSLPAGVFNQIYICPSAPGKCTAYWGDTINSANSLTLPTSGGNLSNVQAYLGFMRDLSIGNRAKGYQTSLANAAQFYATWGDNFSRLPDDQDAKVEESFLGTGYNTYNYSATTGSTWGVPAVDLWFAAAHAAGIHLMFGGPWGDSTLEPCPGFDCTPTEQLNLQRFYAMISARWGAFYDVLELTNEEAPPQAWTDSIGSVLTQGVSGIDGGNPADPYRHFFTTSYFPNNPHYYDLTYGPFSNGNPDTYLNLVDLPHIDGVAGVRIYQWQSDQESDISGCPGSSGYGGTTLPRLNGEEGTSLGAAPASQTAAAPNDEINGSRIVDTTNVLNQCGGAFFSSFSDQMPFNSASPMVTNSWYDASAGRALLQNFMKSLDPAAAPLAVTLGGGCANGKCSYAALGSPSHIRIELNSNTGNDSTGVPDAVNGGTITLSVPESNMTGKWWNTADGGILSTVTSAATPGSQTFTVPNFNVDVWFQLDPATN